MPIKTVTRTGPAMGEKPSLMGTAWLLVHRWKSRIFFAVLDQGVVSTANFFLTVLCAAWMPLAAFGHFVIVWSISQLCEIAQASLILDAMPAIIARHGQRNRRRLDVAALWVVLIFGIATSAAMLACVPGLSRWAPEFALPVLCLVATNPLQRLYLFLRRLCYIRDRQDVAAVASMAYSFTLLGGAGMLILLGMLSVHAIVLLWGAANAAAAAVIYAMGVACAGRVIPRHVGWLARQLWLSGRWLIGAAVGFWLTNWGMLPLIAAASGVEMAGIVRALQNLFTPIVQFNAALNLAILPRVADKAVASGPHYAKSFAIYSSGLFLVIVLFYTGAVMSEANTILALLYRKPEIVAGAYLLWPLGLAMVAESVKQGSTMALLALNKTRIFFVSRTVAVSIFIVGAWSVGRLWAPEGLLWANALSHAAGSAIVICAALALSGKR
jgi:O-antigen/teichoic acid export membrane protein